MIWIVPAKTFFKKVKFDIIGIIECYFFDGILNTFVNTSPDWLRLETYFSVDSFGKGEQVFAEKQLRPGHKSLLVPFSSKLKMFS